MYIQQNKHTNKLKIVEDRIVKFINRMYVQLYEEKKEIKQSFCKLQIILVNGFAFIDKISWDSFNEGKYF